jgi:hypothetical protein
MTITCQRIPKTDIPLNSRDRLLVNVAASTGVPFKEFVNKY